MTPLTGYHDSPSGVTLGVMRETPKARAAFAIYLGLGRDRTLAKTAQAMGKHIRQIEVWSSAHGWVARAEQHDHAELTDAIAARAIARELVVQELVDHGREAARTWISVSSGRIPEGCDMVPLLDRQGHPVMREATDADGNTVQVPAMKPAIPPAVQATASRELLASALGILPPKRVELSGPDKSAIQLSRKITRALPDEGIQLLREMIEATKAASEDDDGHAG